MIGVIISELTQSGAERCDLHVVWQLTERQTKWKLL